MALVKQPRPDSGLGFQVKVLDSVSGVAFHLRSEAEGGVLQGYLTHKKRRPPATLVLEKIEGVPGTRGGDGRDESLPLGLQALTEPFEPTSLNP